MIDFVKFCQDHHVQTADGNDKHYKHGWVNVECPFCYSTGMKFLLGLKIGTRTCNCWQCGFHGLKDVISELAGIPIASAWRLLQEYDRGWIRDSQKTAKIVLSDRCVFPTGTGKLKRHHLRYLEKRGFTEEMLEPWGLKSTGPLGEYKHRIVAPIRVNERLMSYQARDVTDKSNLKYKACKQTNEVIPHQKLLYGMDQVPGTVVVVVEGITDVWKLGPGAVAVFGIDWSDEQAKLLMDYEHVIIMFDREPEAQRRAKQLAKRIYIPDILNPEIAILEKFADPGALSQSKGNSIMKGFGIL